jgi:hypothetical protein
MPTEQNSNQPLDALFWVLAFARLERSDAGGLGACPPPELGAAAAQMKGERTTIV